MVEPTIDPLAWLGKHLEEADTDLLREMVRTFVQALMAAENRWSRRGGGEGRAGGRWLDGQRQGWSGGLIHHLRGRDPRAAIGQERDGTRRGRELPFPRHPPSRSIVRGESDAGLAPSRVAVISLMPVRGSMSTAPVPPIPPKELRFMGDSEDQFTRIGDREVERLRKYAGLESASFVVDIGFGYGRLAHALLRSGEFRGRYVGLDILPRHVAWCTNELAPLSGGRMEFMLLDIQSDRYNPDGELDAASMRIPLEDDSADVVALFSVFAHMYPEGLIHYLREIRRVIRRSGRGCATFFLLDDEWQRIKRAGRDLLPYELTEFCRFADKDDPLYAIGYSLDWVLNQLAKAGLTLAHPIVFGTWREFSAIGGGGGSQDLVVFRRENAGSSSSARG